MSVPVTAVSDGASFDAGASLAAAADVSVDASSSPPPDDTTMATTTKTITIRAPMGPHFFKACELPELLLLELLAGCMIIPLALNGRSRHLMYLNMTQ